MVHIENRGVLAHDWRQESFRAGITAIRFQP